MKESNKIRANSVIPYVVRSYGGLIPEIRVKNRAECAKTVPWRANRKLIKFQKGKK